MSKKSKFSMMSILKSMMSGGKSDLKKAIKDDPDIDLDDIKKFFKDGISDLDAIHKEFANK